MDSSSDASGPISIPSTILFSNALDDAIRVTFATVAGRSCDVNESVHFGPDPNFSRKVPVDVGLCFFVSTATMLAGKLKWPAQHVEESADANAYTTGSTTAHLAQVFPIDIHGNPKIEHL